MAFIVGPAEPAGGLRPRNQVLDDDGSGAVVSRLMWRPPRDDPLEVRTACCRR